jgi:SAM-dependent methyltransferase
MSDSEGDFEASVLGTREYWNHVYERDLSYYREGDNEDEDVGEIWFGEDVEQRMIQYISKHLPVDASVIEVGCGNAHLLAELAACGYRNITGVDYSPAAIDLARDYFKSRSIEARLEVMDLLQPADMVSPQYDIVLDKGTYDAVCLTPSTTDPGERDLEAPLAYTKSVQALLKPGGLFMITSCNWTEKELLAQFTSRGFQMMDRLNHPVFRFGGQVGQTVSTLIFQYQLDDK